MSVEIILNAHTHTNTGTPTHEHTDNAKLNIQNLKWAANRLEKDEDSSSEWKNMAIVFGKEMF